MPNFDCSVCGESFSISQEALDKYPGWKPRFCRAHSPKRGGATTQKRSSSRKSRPKTATVEENLTLDEVLARYSGGPSSGVFTDGSSIPNPGPGGWGVVWVEDGEVIDQRHGHDADTTNNRMELKALIEAFKLLPIDAELSVYTDSKLCEQTINQWAKGWQARGWKRKSGPIKNLELVQELFALAQERPGAKITWIAAHSGNRWNEYADSLSTAWNRSTL